MWEDRSTEIAQLDRPTPLRRFVLEVPATGERWESERDRATVGANPSNDLVLDSRTVSRFHCEIEMREDGAWIRDLESRNGTIVDGMRVTEALLRERATLRLGDQELRFHYGEAAHLVPVSEDTRFGSLLGVSVPMRAAFHMLSLAAGSDVTVLLEGETGTGKDAAADSLHAASRRAEGPFVVVDCSAVAASVIESELFGHEKGAFTGAQQRREGAFEAADGGTVFLDEIGELPLDLQPKLLRVLERKTIQRVGSTARIPINVRIVAATNRDLRREVNRGRFRPDLYYRLAVFRVSLPPLRARPNDVVMIAEAILDGLGASESQKDLLLSDAETEKLRRASWPGNVRELRNYLEQCLVLSSPMPLSQPLEAEPSAPVVSHDPRVPYSLARQHAIASFERGYTAALLERHQGSIPKAAKAAGLHRAHLYRILKRHGLI
ncbi:MAG: sigma 54-interacting transcriptional regulator [Myxococcota bacterium]